VSRRTIFWLVAALAGTILLAVVGAIVFSLLDKDGALGLISDLEDDVAAYLAVFGLVFADAIVPIFPGRKTAVLGPRPSRPAPRRSRRPQSWPQPPHQGGWGAGESSERRFSRYCIWSPMLTTSAGLQDRPVAPAFGTVPGGLL